jgi:hypothetical protein
MGFYVTTNGGSSFGTKAITIDSLARVGIGTTPSSLLHTSAGSDNELRVQSTGSGGSGNTRLRLQSSTATTAYDWYVQGDAGGSLRFYDAVAGTDRARIDSSGRLLVGTSSARSNVRFNADNKTPSVQFETAGNEYYGLSVIHNSNAGYSGNIWIGAANGTAIGSNGLVGGQALGNLHFVGGDGTNLIHGARIHAETDGTTGANDLPTRLVFSTTADGASSPTERMRIQQDGRVLIGKTSAGDYVTGIELQPAGAVLSYRTSSVAGIFGRTDNGETVRFTNNGSTVGSISTTGAATAYNTSSDYRLKENVVPLTGAADRLNQLQVHRFNFIADPDTTVDGFIAHEAQAVVPECVTGTKDEVDADGNPIYQGIDQSKLVPLLTAALQEAMERIETLEAEVAALKTL